MLADQPASRAMTRRLCTVGMEATVEQAEELLNRHRLSAMPVVDAAGRLFGILAAGDFLQFHAAKRNARSVRAWELCTYRPASMPPESRLRDVAKAMVANRIHHVPIVSGGELLGIVSSLDLVEQFVLEAAS